VHSELVPWKFIKNQRVVVSHRTGSVALVTREGKERDGDGERWREMERRNMHVSTHKHTHELAALLRSQDTNQDRNVI